MIFIRPWFLLLLFIPVLLWLLKGKLAPQAALSKYIDERLLPFVTIRFGGVQRQTRSWLFALVWTGLVIAGAGPAYEKVTVPVKVTAPAHVIVLDMSPAMNGEILEAAKRKLYDLLNALKGDQVGLVVYDEHAYVVSPLTQDLNIIRSMIPALNTTVMPTYGNKAEKGFEKASELFKNVDLNKGQIIFLTAGGFEADKLNQVTKNMPYQIASIGFGNREEKPFSLPNGDFLRNVDGSLAFAKLDVAALQKMGVYSTATVDDKDIIATLAAFEDNEKVKGSSDSSTADVWRDLGPLILLIMSPFFAFLFRRGVIYVFIGTLLCVSATTPAQASEWFLRSDQQEYQVLKQGVNAYRKGTYEQAKKAFESLNKTPIFLADAYYNTGNALAHLNDIEGAIEAYDKALKLDPSHQDAKYNKEYLLKQIPPKEQSQQTPQENQGQSDQSKDVADKPNNSQDKNNTSNEQDTQTTSQEFTPKDSDEFSNPNEQSNTNADDTMNTQGQANQIEKSSKPTTGSQNQFQPTQSKQVQSENFESDNRPQEQRRGEQIQGVPETVDAQNDAFENSDAIVRSLDNPLNQDMSTRPQNTQNLPTPGTQKTPLQQPQDLLDQDAAQLLNRVQDDPSGLLRYRLRQQWRQQQ